MSSEHGHDSPYDPAVGFHPRCVTDPDRPLFDADWQRRAFGLAVALAEFGHYPWADFQHELITSIGAWETAPADERGRWDYYQHWTAALTRLVRNRGILDAPSGPPEQPPAES